MNLYADENVEKALDEEAQVKFDKYITQLSIIADQCKENSQLDIWIIWEKGLRELYKEMVFDAFEAMGIPFISGMEIYFSGSLGKKQATQYSDLDAFALFQTEEDKQQAQPVFENLNNLCQRIFSVTHQLYPDPIGINPARLSGTVDALFQTLKDGDVVDPGPIVHSILSSKPILGRHELGDQLRQKIKADEDFLQYANAKIFYDMAIDEFAAPNLNATEVNIKSHIMRPLDFMLMGLREEFDLTCDDGSHLSAPGTFRLLREDGYLPKEQITLLEDVYNIAMTLRTDQHNRHQEENDSILKEQVEGVLKIVEELREVFRERRETLANPIQGKPKTLGNKFVENLQSLIDAIKPNNRNSHRVSRKESGDTPPSPTQNRRSEKLKSNEIREEVTYVTAAKKPSKGTGKITLGSLLVALVFIAAAAASAMLFLSGILPLAVISAIVVAATAPAALGGGGLIGYGLSQKLSSNTPPTRSATDENNSMNHKKNNLTLKGGSYGQSLYKVCDLTSPQQPNEASLSSKSFELVVPVSTKAEENLPPHSGYVF